MEPNLSNENQLKPKAYLFYLEYDPIAWQATEIVSHLMKIMKLVIGNSNNPCMTENCTLKPILNPHQSYRQIADAPPDQEFE